MFRYYRVIERTTLITVGFMMGYYSNNIYDKYFQNKHEDNIDNKIGENVKNIILKIDHFLEKK
jgi:hypothetical protein